MFSVCVCVCVDCIDCVMKPLFFNVHDFVQCACCTTLDLVSDTTSIIGNSSDILLNRVSDAMCVCVCVCVDCINCVMKPLFF